MFLDGDKVKVNDRVFHISAGYGMVETIHDNNARVRMESGGILNMSDGGLSGVRKAFYWYEPFFLLPRKGKAEMHKQAIEVATAVIKMLEV